MGMKNLVGKIKKDQKEKDVSFEDEFVKQIDTFLVAPPKEPRPVRRAFRPSSYYKCMRQTFYFLTGAQPKGKKYARSERILQVGTALHKWIQSDVLMEMAGTDDYPLSLLAVEELPSYGKAGIEFIQDPSVPPMEVKFVDTRFTDKFPISAMVDGSLTMKNKNFLFEFKTINPKDFDFLIEPLADHIKQGAIYSLCTGIHTVMFLYLCKGTQKLKGYTVKYTQRQLDWVVERIQQTEDYAINMNLPPKEVSQQCQWCSYKHLCDKEQVSD